MDDLIHLVENPWIFSSIFKVAMFFFSLFAKYWLYWEPIGLFIYAYHLKFIEFFTLIIQSSLNFFNKMLSEKLFFLEFL